MSAVDRRYVMDNNALSNRFEDALDFLEALPDLINLSAGAGTVHYLIEPTDVIRTSNQCLITGAALLVHLVLLRTTGYRTEVICHTPGREEIILYLENTPTAS